MGSDHHMGPGGSGTVKNVVLFVGSGLGPAGVTLARSFQEVLRKGDASVPTTLAFEPYLTATLRTRSYDKYPIPTACVVRVICVVRVRSCVVVVAHALPWLQGDDGRGCCGERAGDGQEDR